jgi:hypothetical protein
MGQQLRLNLGIRCDVVAQRLTDAPVQNLAPAFEQILISRILDERVLKPIVGVGRQALH